MIENIIAGGCFCGRIRYEISGSLGSASICHCVSCRRAVGAESVAWVECAVEDFKFTKTMPNIFHSSEGVQRTFCHKCGTSLTYQVKIESIDIALATLDEPENIVPMKEIWVESKLSWNALHGGIPTYNKDV